jgi:hypothetical protein
MAAAQARRKLEDFNTLPEKAAFTLGVLAARLTRVFAPPQSRVFFGRDLLEEARGQEKGNGGMKKEGGEAEERGKAARADAPKFPYNVAGSL